LAIEKGKFNPSMKLALQIAHAIGVRVDEIFFSKEMKMAKRVNFEERHLSLSFMIIVLGPELWGSFFN
jgi:DNA-binding XRE family transcriptional regulator